MQSDDFSHRFELIIQILVILETQPAIIFEWLCMKYNLLQRRKNEQTILSQIALPLRSLQLCESLFSFLAGDGGTR